MTGNHRRPVETGRWDDIPLNEQKCNICTTDDIGDEYNYLFTCDFLRVTERIFETVLSCYKPNKCKFRELFTSTNEATLKLSKVVAIIMEKFSM